LSETEDFCEAPKPKEMIDLEVIFFSNETNPKCYEIIFIF
jgi:hypothetical protein